MTPWKTLKENPPKLGKKVIVRLRENHIIHFGIATYGEDYSMINGGAVHNRHISHYQEKEE